MRFVFHCCSSVFITRLQYFDTILRKYKQLKWSSLILVDSRLLYLTVHQITSEDQHYFMNRAMTYSHDRRGWRGHWGALPLTLFASCGGQTVHWCQGIEGFKSWWNVKFFYYSWFGLSLLGVLGVLSQSVVFPSKLTCTVTVCQCIWPQANQTQCRLGTAASVLEVY